MSITLDATFSGGTFHPAHPVELPEGATVRLTVEPATSETATPCATETPCDEEDPLEAVIGICKTGPPFSLADHHDELLYGLRLRGGNSP